MFPDFLGIGAQKAGTTWLHANLSACDEIWLPHLKELHYFDRKFPLMTAQVAAESGLRRSALEKHLTMSIKRLSLSKMRDRLAFRRWGDITWELRYLFGRWDDAWYESLFEHGKDRVVGEITPAYSCPAAPRGSNRGSA